LAMGLDRDDTIVRRRLAQKLEFLMEDLGELGNPTDAELSEFLKKHSDRYQVPGRLSFEHVYFSLGKRGKLAERDARKDLARLRAGASAAVIEELGDAFLLEYRYKQATLEEVEKVFGPGFGAELIKLPKKEWQGPITSGYGLHLVKVDEHETSLVSDLDRVREQVKRDWLDARRREMKEAGFKKLRDRYEVVVDDKSLRAAEVALQGNAGSRP
jgi:PPIC-type PPIASE domain